MKIYIVGAQSVGKTTLIRQLQQMPEFRHQLEVVSEVARDLIRSERLDLRIFQDYRSHEEEFYQFNVRLVRRYLEMARKDMSDSQTVGSSRTKVYDRSGADAIAYICTYLPHLADRMLAEECSSELLKLYSRDPDMRIVVIEPQAEFIAEDSVRLPPTLPELLHYTRTLRILLQEIGISWLDLTQKDLAARVQTLVDVMRERQS